MSVSYLSSRPAPFFAVRLLSGESGPDSGARHLMLEAFSSFGAERTFVSS